MAKLLKMLWEYMDLTVLPFFETWIAHIFGGWQRVCWCTNEAFNQASPTNFEKTALRKRVGIFTVKMRGGHIYGNYFTMFSAQSLDRNMALPGCLSATK